MDLPAADRKTVGDVWTVSLCSELKQTQGWGGRTASDPDKSDPDKGARV